jgi:hypothetical protein
MAEEEASRRLARIIAGNEPPSWLFAAAAKARDTLYWTIKSEREYLRRSEMRAWLEEMAAAIETVRAAMWNDFDMMTLLRAGDAFLLNENEMFHGLVYMAERVKETLAKIPAGKGRHKYFWRSEGATPQQLCALMVSILWELVHSAAPPNTNAEAQEACAWLWVAAGGLVEREGKIVGKWGATGDGASVSVWRDHLRAAKLLAQSDEAKRLRRSLSPNSAWEVATPEEIEIIRTFEG